MPLDRSEDRNVHFFDESKSDTVLGGLVQNGSVTEKNFLSMLAIVLVTEAPIYVYAKATGIAVLMGDEALQVGDYMIRGEGKQVYYVMVWCLSNEREGEIHLSDELWVQRLISFNVSGREDSFREGIRSRDRKCVITGVVNRRTNNWTRFEAAHIFPLEKEGHWIRENYGRWITGMDDTNGVSKINSIQNGFLLKADVHQDFDQYLVSVNPDVS